MEESNFHSLASLNIEDPGLVCPKGAWISFTPSSPSLVSNQPSEAINQPLFLMMTEHTQALSAVTETSRKGSDTKFLFQGDVIREWGPF